MEWLVDIIKKSPELSIFLALGLGVGVGRINYKGFSLGTVTGVLLMGIVVGQLHLEISDIVKSTFFLLFLFAVGYSVGPQFIQSVKKAVFHKFYSLVVPVLLAYLQLILLL